MEPIKTVMIGQSTVGKTSIVLRMVHGSCDEKPAATVGVTFMTYVQDNIRYQMWDTAGQERFHSLMPMHFRNARIIMFVFDVNNLASLNAIEKYTSDLLNIENYLIIIVGNKIDLFDEESNDEDDYDEMMATTKEKLKNSPLNPFIFNYVFVSAKTGENFDALLETIDDCGKAAQKDPELRSYIPMGTDMQDDQELSCVC